MTLRAASLLEIMPKCPREKAVDYAAALSEAMAEENIVTAVRAAAFLGQLAHESGELRYMAELGDGKAYEGRKDLGNVNRGDGPRYRGRGPIQLTGRANYRSAGSALGLPLEEKPELAAVPAVGFRVAAWYWGSRDCNAKADRFDFLGITRAINGGINGHALRTTYYHRALEVLGRDVRVIGGQA